MKVFGYIRVSTDTQAEEGVSLDAQRNRIAAYCIAHSLELVQCVQETASAKTLDRPELRAVLHGLSIGEAQGVVVTKLDRLTRSVRDLGELLEGPFADRYTLFCVDEGLDSRKQVGRLVLNMLGAVARWELDQIRARTVEGLAEARRQGAWLGGVPLGLRRDTTRRDAESGRALVVVDHQELAALRAIMAARTQGLKTSKIATWLNTSTQFKRRSGRPWTYDSVKHAIAWADRVFAFAEVLEPKPAVSRATRALSAHQADMFNPASFGR